MDISTKKIDGRQATKIVVQYFLETYGANGVVQFEVANVDFEEKRKIWRVGCSFFRNLLASVKDSYEVEVDSEGNIANVKRIEKQQSRE